MNIFQAMCWGCRKKFPKDDVSREVPKLGHLKDFGEALNPVFICAECYQEAVSNGYKLPSKREASRWKSRISKLHSKSTSLSSEEMFKLANQQMMEELGPDIEQMVQDVLLKNERIICKIRSSPGGDRSNLTLTNLNLLIINKGFFGGQLQDTPGGILGLSLTEALVSVRIYPISEIRNIEIQPIYNNHVGHFQIFTSSTLEEDNETKFLFDTDIGYYKSVLLYKQLRQLQGLGNRTKQQSSNQSAFAQQQARQ